MAEGNQQDTISTGIILAPEQIKRRIYSVRGQNVMVDSDLAQLYEVETYILNRAVQRNKERFPEDFMFQLTSDEAGALRFQFGISNTGRGGRRYLPYAFTEQGVAMLSSVLRSERAVQVNIALIRAFVAMRGLLTQDNDLARRIIALEAKYDKQFAVVFEAIRQLMDSPPAPDRRMGFRSHEEDENR